jgi:hypothetical protein
MSSPLDFIPDALADTTRSLERTLAETRAQWDDTARQAFDRRHADPILADARKATRTLSLLAQELSSAMRLLDSSGQD